jgi:two-component system OmpR family response regulator
MLPDFNGPEVARRIRGMQPDVAVLFISGVSEHPAVRRATTSGDRFLAKPFTLVAFRQHVRELIAGRRAA